MLASILASLGAQYAPGPTLLALLGCGLAPICVAAPMLTLGFATLAFHLSTRRNRPQARTDAGCTTRWRSSISAGCLATSLDGSETDTSRTAVLRYQRRRALVRCSGRLSNSKLDRAFADGAKRVRDE